MIRVQWVKRPDLTIAVMDADGGVEERGAGEDGEAERPYCAEFGPFPPESSSFTARSWRSASRWSWRRARRRRFLL